MKLISWNIQWCRGMDGKVDPARIARESKALCDPDVCCFQEVAINYPALEGSSGEDQPAELARAFPGYSGHFAPVVDVPDEKAGRRQFGNLILSRLPVRQVFRHTLPWPPEDKVPSMPRIAIEAVIEAPWGLVSVLSTHLEFFSSKQRAAQVARPGTPHPPTFCLFDDTYEKVPYCCDFVFPTADLAARLASVRVGLETKASDHQPVIAEFRP